MNCPVCATLNPSANRFCRDCGAPLSGLPSGESERRVVTVLFADMSGSTALAERLADPERITEIMSEFYQELAACVHRYGGTVDKFLGDGIMANFGAPRAHEDDPERAVATALEMREGLGAVNTRLAAVLPSPFGIHIGINTGEVVAGRVGAANRSEYTVLGDAVNVAARLESESEDGQILVSESTWQKTEHAFAFRELPAVRVKGKTEPVKVWEVLGRRARRREPRERGLETPLVGRQAEMARLEGTLGRLAGGTGGVVAVSGAAGVGKSRLIAEVRALATGRGMRWVQASCPSLGMGGTLGVWVDLVTRLQGIEDGGVRGSGSVRRTGALRTGGGTRVISLTELRDASATLARLLHIDLNVHDLRRTGGVDEEAVRSRLFLGVRDLVEAEASKQPLVIVLDDLHWADSASMQLLSRVLESTNRAPLLVMAAFRSDAETVRAPLDDAVARSVPPFRIDIDLHALPRDHAHALAEAMVGDEPELELVDLLVNASDGNPLFMEEVLLTLADQRAAERRDGAWRLTGKAGAVVVPETLQGLLLDRIDRLNESTKRVVQIAAVIGRSFPSDLLGDILGLRSEPTPLLAQLEHAGIIERTPAENSVLAADFRFRHALIQEAAYASLLHKHRQAYHRRVADWYEQAYAMVESPPGLAAVLAHHFDRAGATQKAAIWTLRAADDARRSFALAEARDRYTRVLQLLEVLRDPDVRAGALLGLGEIYVAEGEAEKALEQFMSALDIVRDPLQRATLERRMGQMYDRLGLQDPALKAFSRAAAILGDEQGGEPAERSAERGRLRVARAYAHLNKGDEAAARATAEAALRADLPAGDRADATTLLGASLFRRGQFEEAAARFQEALTLARTAGDLLREASVLEMLARADRRRGRYAEATASLHACLSLRRRLGDESGCGVVLVEIALIEAHHGALDAAEAHLREAIVSASECDEPVTAARAALHLGRLLRARGDWRAARAALERAGADDPEIAGRVALELALLAVARREAPEGELRAAIAGAESHGDPETAAYARLSLAMVTRRLGRRDEARALLRAVLTSPIGSSGEAASAARVELAELALEDARPDAALVAAQIALAAAEQSGPALLAWRARRILGAALAAAGQGAEADAELVRVVDLARSARVFPELSRALEIRARLHSSGGAPTPAAQSMLVEMRAITSYLAGGAPPDALPEAESTMRYSPMPGT